uniref:Taste receptor type 2 n=1 Tax=Malurus cyaneus samueli TaxID=2593467 RepID=A0A8C5T5E3_9PASS
RLSAAQGNLENNCDLLGYNGHVFSKKLCPYDMIMISLSSSRIVLQFWCTLDLLVSVFCEHSYYEEKLFPVITAVYMFLDYCSLWFGAWLSVFYCIKVASFTQFLLHLAEAKNCQAGALDGAHIMALLLSIRTTRKDSLGLLILLCNAAISLPLILSVVSSVLLIRSLWVHSRRMQNNASGFRDPSLEAHVKALKSVCSFLISHIIYFICVLLFLWDTFSHFSNGESICIAVMAACPTGHTMVLIWSNPKFLELSARIWQHITSPVRTRSMYKTMQCTYI